MIGKRITICKKNSFLLSLLLLMTTSNFIGAKNVVVKKSNNLVVYFPFYNSIELYCENMPDTTEANVLMCCEAAFTGELLEVFKHGNIGGYHVANGTLYKGFACKANTGCFAWYADDKTWKFAFDDYFDCIKDANKRGGMAFGQSMIIYYGKPQRVVVPRNKHSKNEYRALAELNGKLCIIDSDGVMEFQQFVNNMLALKVTHALYLDMGEGWNYSFYRDNNNSIKFIHNKQIPYTTNWVVFKK